MDNGISFGQIRESLTKSNKLNLDEDGKVKNAGYTTDEINDFIDDLSEVDLNKDQILQQDELQGYLSKEGITYNQEKDKFVIHPDKQSGRITLDLIQDGIAANSEWAVQNAHEVKQEKVADRIMDDARDFTMLVDGEKIYGTGFILKREDDTYIIATSKHLTKGSDTVDISHPEVLNGDKVKGEVIAESEDKDIAFVRVKLPEEAQETLSVAPLEKFDPDQDVSSYGYPAPASPSPPKGRYKDYESKGGRLSHEGIDGPSYLNARYNPETNTVNASSGEEIKLPVDQEDDTKLINVVEEGYEIMTNDGVIAGQSGGPTLEKDEDGNISVVGMSGWSELGEETVYSKLRQRLIDHNPDDERFSNGFSMSIPIEHIIQELNDLTEYKMEL